MKGGYIMNDFDQKKIFAKNLNRYLSINNKTQKEVADAINVSPQTFNTWCQGIALPRMGKVQRLADYFSINKSDLIDEKSDLNEIYSPDFFVSLSSIEKQILIEYRNSDTYTQDLVQRVLKLDGLNYSKDEK